MKRTRIILLLALLIPFTGKLAAQSPAQVTLVKAGRLLDPKTGNVLSPAAVLIEGGKIKEVGAPAQVQAHLPVSAKAIDLGAATLLPGLIDSHTHLLLDVIVPPEEEYERRFNGDFVPDQLLAIVESPSKRAFLGAQFASGMNWPYNAPFPGILSRALANRSVRQLCPPLEILCSGILLRLRLGFLSE